MPRGDGTGPGGMGPRTGRGAGYCSGYEVPGYVNRGAVGGAWGRGGMGRGHGGRGWRHWYYATGQPGWARAGWMPGGVVPPGAAVVNPATWAPPEIPKEQEVESLKAQADYFSDALDEIKKRLSELESESE